MPAHKRQHFVPRCYLKPFSLDGLGVAINVHNISLGRAIRNAPMRGQCAKDYLYGEDLVLERQLQRVEGEYARILRLLQGLDPTLTDGDLYSLRAFAYLQYSRTDMAAHRARIAQGGLHRLAHEGKVAKPPDFDLSDRTMMRSSMRAFSRTYRYLGDLRVCIVQNDTPDDFITSDDPAILTSRYHIQRLGRTNFGIASSGVLLFLPLTPRLTLMCYDGDVDTVPEKRGHFVSITKPADVLALNELQYLKAAANIYFARWDDRDRIEEEFETFRHARPETWSNFFVGVPDKVVPRIGTRYRRAGEEERKASREMIVAVGAVHPAPSRWLSKLKYRDPIRFYSNGSAAGHLRKASWLILDQERSPVAIDPTKLVKQLR